MKQITFVLFFFFILALQAIYASDDATSDLDVKHGPDSHPDSLRESDSSESSSPDHDEPDHLNDDEDDFFNDSDDSDDSDDSGSDSHDSDSDDCDPQKRALCLVLLGIGAVLVLGTIYFLRKKKKLCFKGAVGTYSNVKDVEGQFELTEKPFKNQIAPAPIMPTIPVNPMKDSKSAPSPAPTSHPHTTIPVAVAGYPDAASMMAMPAAVAHVTPVYSVHPSAPPAMSVATIQPDSYPYPKF